MPLFLLNEILRSQTGTVVRVVYRPSDHTPLERAFLRLATTQTPLEIRPDSGSSEEVFIFIFDSSSNDNDQERAVESFLSRLNVSDTQPISTLAHETPSQHSVLLKYGPALHGRPTQLALEWADLNTVTTRQSCIGRIERGRLLTFRSALETTGQVEEEVFSDLISQTDLSLYNNLSFPFQEFPLDALIQTSGTLFQTETDPIHDAIFSQHLGLLSLARQVITSTGNTTAHGGGLYTVIPIDRAHIRSLQVTGPTKLITRTYSLISYTEMLMDAVREQISVFPLACLSGTQVGAFVPTLFEPGSYSQAIHNLKFLSEQTTLSETLCRLGVPVLNGFHRIWEASDNQAQTWSKSINFYSLISSVTENESHTSRLRPGQYIVCLGDFISQLTTIQSSDLYCESPSIWMKLCQALALSHQLCRPPMISSSARRPRFASTAEQLSALIGGSNLGLRLFVSGLPEPVLNELRMTEDPTHLRQELEVYLRQYFLNGRSPCMFFVIDDRQVDVEGAPTSCLTVLLNSCKQYRCAATVLGVTTPNAYRLDIVDDSVHPICPQSMLTDNRAPTISLQMPRGRKRARTRDVEDDILFVSETPGARGHAITRLLGDTIDIENLIQQTLSHPVVASKEYLTYHMDRCGCLGTVAQQCGVGELDLPMSDYSIVVNTSLITPKRRQNSRASPHEPTIWRHLTLEDMFQYSLTSSSLAWSGYVCGLGEQTKKVLLDPVRGAQYTIIEALTNCMLAAELRLEDFTLSLSVIWPEHDTQRLEIMLFGCKELVRELGCSLEVKSGMAASITVPRHDAPPDTTSCDSRINAVVCSAKCEFKKMYKVNPCLTTVHTHILVLFGDANPRPLLTGSLIHPESTMRNELPEPDIDSIKNLFYVSQRLLAKKFVLSGHDISDGGLVTTLIEMAIGGNLSMTVNIPESDDPLKYLWSETPGLVVEVLEINTREVLKICKDYNVRCRLIGRVNPHLTDPFVIKQGQRQLFSQSVSSLRTTWSSFSDRMNGLLESNKLRGALLTKDYGNMEIYLGDDSKLMENLRDRTLAIYAIPDKECTVAFLSMPGFVLHESLVTAFMNAGFTTLVINAFDPNLRQALRAVKGLVIGCDPSYRQNLHAMNAYTEGITSNVEIRSVLEQFLANHKTFSLAVGAFGFLILERLGAIGKITPEKGASSEQSGPDLVIEEASSGRFESRWLNIRIPETSRSIAMLPLKSMILPCWVQGTHLGVSPTRQGVENLLYREALVACTYHGHTTDSDDYAKHYPRNPSHGLPICGVSSSDGRHTALLFDPSLAYHLWQWQHIPSNEYLSTSPWSLMFHSLHIWASQI
ncbi:tegument protein [Vombatid gammaherpesvirus 1]|uniref:Tegument protein n=1 Tax=Vombatid gammaherpesvirus 1 TaxID=2052651 RepID=A0A3S8D7F6_9GAMA|nr:tegument protein [Vombatid gammaherpesvirus 1]AZB49173.1 tegument protein [Vombatid gammaherpesvirus 1]